MRLENSIGYKQANTWISIRKEREEHEQEILHSLRQQPVRRTDGASLPGREDRRHGGTEDWKLVFRTHATIEPCETGGAGPDLGDFSG